MGDRELSRWVSDSLHDVLGFSENSTVQYVIAMARRAAKSGQGAAGLLIQLQEMDVPSTPASKAFATQLISR